MIFLRRLYSRTVQGRPKQRPGRSRAAAYVIAPSARVSSDVKFAAPRLIYFLDIFLRAVKNLPFGQSQRLYSGEAPKSLSGIRLSLSQLLLTSKVKVVLY